MAWVQDGTKNIPWMNNCEGLYAAWETDMETLAKLIPAPLTPVIPYVIAYVVEARNPTFCNAYKEACVMTVVTDGEKMGNYTFGLLLTDSDNPVLTGREELGIPKKNADLIDIRRLGDKAYATVDRMGIRVFDLEVELGDYNNEAGAAVLGGKPLGEDTEGISFFYKFDVNQNANCDVVFSDLRMLDVRMVSNLHTWEAGAASIELGPSINDPWAELVVKQPIGAAWTIFDLGILGAQKVTPLDMVDKVIPHLIAGRYDASFVGNPNQIL